VPVQLTTTVEDLSNLTIKTAAFDTLLDIINNWDATITISASATFPDGGFFLHFEHSPEIETEYLPEELEAEGEDLPAAIDALQEEISSYEKEVVDLYHEVEES
jgi:hypothetical protein